MNATLTRYEVGKLARKNRLFTKISQYTAEDGKVYYEPMAMRDGEEAAKWTCGDLHSKFEDAEAQLQVMVETNLAHQ